MENKRIVVIAALVCAALLLVNVAGVWSLKAENEELRSQLSSAQSMLSNQIMMLSSDVNNLKNDIRMELDESASLLSDSDITFGVENGMLAVIASAAPKQISSGEQVYFDFNAGEQTDTVPATQINGQYSAVGRLALCDYVTVAVRFVSDAGVRQEMLPEADVLAQLSLSYESLWMRDFGSVNGEEYDAANDGRIALRFFSYSDDRHPVYEDIKTIQLVVRLNDGSEEKAQELARVEMTQMSQGEMERIGIYDKGASTWMGDLTDYMHKDGSYAAYCEMETGSGIRYNIRIAEFENVTDTNGATSSFGGNSSDIAYPIFERN